MTPEIRRRRMTALAIVVGALAIMIVLIALRPRPQRQRPPVVPPLVTVETVTDARQPMTVTGWGTVQPKDTITLVPQVGGLVVAVSANLRAGGYVTSGEVLVFIETADYELAVEQAHSQVAQAEVGLALAREEAEAARIEWERTRRHGLNLSRAGEAGTNSAGALDSEPGPLVLRQPQLRQAESQLAAARAALKRAKLELRRCQLVAPFTGRVQSKTVAAGQVVRPAEALAILYDTSTAEITVNLPDRDLAWVTLPMTPTDLDQGTDVVVSAAFGGGQHTWPGRAVRLGGSVDPGSRQVPVVVEVPAPYERHEDRPPLLSGMFVSVAFFSEPPLGSVTIPRQALRPDDLVWVLDAEDRLRIRPVTVARAHLETAVISGGLTPGDRLVTSNLQYVIDGMQCAPLSDTDARAGLESERP